MRNYHWKSERIGCSKWNSTDLDLARSLWGDREVTRYICATGAFSEQEITARLNVELYNEEHFQVQYWPIFKLDTDELIGCCGLRPFPSEENSYELGFHLRKGFWGRGYASEAAKLVIDHSFRMLHADKLLAGHHPQNTASERLLLKLGFQYLNDIFYEPTGLYHPCYALVNQML